MAQRGRKPGFRMSEEHRTKIANSKILNELIKFAEGKTLPDEYPPHRVTATLGLLKKVMPDMAQTDVTSGGEKITMPTEVVLKAARDHGND